MMDRRSFLASVPLIAGAAAGCSRPAEQGSASQGEPNASLPGQSAGMPDALGVQLYTLRSVMQDPAATLATLASLGYREVELAGLYGLSPQDLRGLLDDAGLRTPSTHVGLERFEPDARDALFDEAATLGHEWLVCPWTPEELRTPDGYRRLADLFNEAGEAAGARGLSVGYHNHAFEFEPLDGGPSGLEILLERGSPGLLSFQLDLFWAVDAGEDPVSWFAAHPGRWASVHAKDRTTDGTMVAVGDGTLDFAELIDAGVASGVQHVFVEHDQPTDPIESVARSLRHLESLRQDGA
jgi:sugar phosphate isomerase/epimerase